MKYLIALGSNLGDRRRYIDTASELLGVRSGSIIRKSSIYVTAPVGMTAQKDFYNQVLILNSELMPLELLTELMSIERELGRVRHDETRYSSRSIDLDILLAEDLVMQTETLQIPHPRMAQRRFVLVPAVEVASEWIHPILKLPLSSLLMSCNDHEKVSLL